MRIVVAVAAVGALLVAVGAALILPAAGLVVGGTELIGIAYGLAYVGTGGERR